MSLISSTTSVCVYYAGLEIFREYAPTVTRALVSEVAKRQLECYIGTLIAGPSVFLMGMSLPFLTDRIEHLMGMSLRDRETVDVANWTRVATCIYFTRGDIFKIFVAILRRSPAQFAYDYGTDMIKAMVLDSACQKISKKTGRYAGNIVYAVASTKLMPNTSPFALSIANGLIYMITMIRNRFLAPLIQPFQVDDLDFEHCQKWLNALGECEAENEAKYKKAAIELDDFNLQEDDFILI